MYFTVTQNVNNFTRIKFSTFFINIDFQITKFGKILKNQDGSEYHGIIKSPPELKIWKKASEFKSDISIKNLQPYEFRHHFLPPKNFRFVINVL